LLDGVSCCERLLFRSCTELTRVNLRRPMSNIWHCCAETFSGDTYVVTLVALY